MNLSHLRGLALVGLALGSGSLAAQAPARYQVTLTEADGRLLVGEELSKGNNGVVRLSLSQQGNPFQIQNGRITLAATAATDMLTCPVWISGVPVIASNRLSMTAADVRTDGVLCNGTLTVLKPKALESLTAHPWDLAGRLAKASANPSLPGPRLPVSGCVAVDQLTLREVHASGNSLVVGVDVAPRAAGNACS